MEASFWIHICMDFDLGLGAYMINTCLGKSIEYLRVFAWVLSTCLSQIWTWPIMNIRVQNPDSDMKTFCCMSVITPTLTHMHSQTCNWTCVWVGQTSLDLKFDWVKLDYRTRLLTRRKTHRKLLSDLNKKLFKIN